MTQPSTGNSPDDSAGAARSSPSVGLRVRALRQQQEMTLQVLADKANVTPSFISQVENDASNPSLQTLRQIAAALEVPIFYLFEEVHDAQVVVRKHERVEVRRPGAQVSYELLSPNSRRKLEMFRMVLEPGGATFDEPMAHHGEECATVLKGRIRVEVGGHAYDLRTGDTIYFDSGLPHRAVNVGDSSATMISAITPPSF
jgi:transcriptional regulator with XRE-family HTH domain